MSSEEDYVHNDDDIIEFQEDPYNDGPSAEDDEEYIHHLVENGEGLLAADENEQPPLKDDNWFFSDDFDTSDATEITTKEDNGDFFADE